MRYLDLTRNQQRFTKVLHKLFPTLPLQTSLQLIDLTEHFTVKRELLSDLFHTADYRGVITTVKDSGDHGIRVVVEQIANEIHRDVTRVH